MTGRPTCFRDQPGKVNASFLPVLRLVILPGNCGKRQFGQEISFAGLTIDGELSGAENRFATGVGFNRFYKCWGQSISPMSRRKKLGLAELRDPVFSIPAPARGATAGNASNDFIDTFQFSPLREGRRSRHPPAAVRSHFNSRPCERGDARNKPRHTLYFLFQFSPLREGRPLCGDDG